MKFLTLILILISSFTNGVESASELVTIIAKPRIDGLRHCIDITTTNNSPDKDIAFAPKNTRDGGYEFSIKSEVPHPLPEELPKVYADPGMGGFHHIYTVKPGESTLLTYSIEDYFKMNGLSNFAVVISRNFPIKLLNGKEAEEVKSLPRTITVKFPPPLK